MPGRRELLSISGLDDRQRKMTPSENDILEIHERWLAAEISQDKNTIETLLHEDLHCVLPGGSRLTGKQAFLKCLGEETVSIKKIEISNIWVSVDSVLALKIADFETHFSDPSLPIVSGTHLWGLRKVKGNWKIQMITWTIKGESGSRG